MRILVTGAAGFAGRHLLPELARGGHEVIAFDVQDAAHLKGASETVTGDLRDRDALATLVAERAPDACIHLGAVTYVPSGQSKPELMLAVNIAGTLNLLDAFRAHADSARLLVVSTAHVYGSGTRNRPLDEETPLRPLNLYSVSKTAADLTALAYADRHGMAVMTARPSNHTGPGQAPPFAVPSFAVQVKAIARRQAEPSIVVGNLDSVREFTDVRDVVRAYRLLIEEGHGGRAYNIGSGECTTMQDVLKRLCKLAGVSPRIQVDPGKVRPTDHYPQLDTARIRADVGWTPAFDLNRTLKDMLEQI